MGRAVAPDDLTRPCPHRALGRHLSPRWCPRARCTRAPRGEWFGKFLLFIAASFVLGFVIEVIKCFVAYPLWRSLILVVVLFIGFARRANSDAPRPPLTLPTVAAGTYIFRGWVNLLDMSSASPTSSGPSRAASDVTLQCAVANGTWQPESRYLSATLIGGTTH